MNNYELHMKTHTCHDDCQNPICVAVREATAAKPPTHSEQWWRHEVSNAWAAGYEKGRASVKQSEQEPVAWIKERELLYMQAVAAHGKTDWKTNLGLKPEDGDVPLYTTPPQREWQGLTDEEMMMIYGQSHEGKKYSLGRAIEAKLKEKNA